MNNPVFQKRSIRAAVQIQAQIRRVLAFKAFEAQRQAVAAVQIQRTVRGFVQHQAFTQTVEASRAAVVVQKTWRGYWMRHMWVQNYAATELQRLVRGFIGRMRGKVARLERLLQTVQAEHAQELRGWQADALYL